LLLQQNNNASSCFNRSWYEYSLGFSDSEGNYWIGNHVLTWLTRNGNYKLKIDLQSRTNKLWYYAEYNTFVVLPEIYNYKLMVDGYSGRL